MAALPPGCILKSLAGLSRRPHHEVDLLKVRTGAGMDEEADREAAHGGEDALALDLNDGQFLGMHVSLAPTHVCPSVCPSVRPLVRPSVGPSVTLS